MPPVESVVEATASKLLTDVQTALPALVAGAVFLLLAAGGVRAALWVVRLLLRRAFPNQPIYVQVATTVTGLFLGFGVLLSFLSIVGLPSIAASLGTASGFLALGVSYALSGMLADAVAGVYLLRDPDFNPGDRVQVGSTEGVVERIELRKTRLAVDGDTVVRGNADIEKQWTRRAATTDGETDAERAE